MLPGRGVLCAVTVCLAVLGPARSAHAGDVAVCARASEDAQELRSRGRLRAAREKLLVCIRDTCPGVIGEDCTRWLGEVEAAMPTVVIDARDEQGHDVVDLHVTADGEPFAERLDGKAIAIDPGVHTLRYELAGSRVVEEEILVREGQKNRALTVAFKAASGSWKGPPVGTFVLTGAAVVAAGGYAYFGISAQQGADTLRSTCAPKCATSAVDDLRTKAIAANVLFGVGVVALGAGLVAWITHRSDAEAPAIGGVSLDVMPVVGGGTAAVRASF